MSCLANGAAAADRFPADLARARTAALRSPAFTATGPGSPAAAELALRIAVINGLDSGCAVCGGFIVTTLEPVVWHPVTIAGTRWDGAVGGSGGQPSSGIRFQATYVAGKDWTVRLCAC